MTRKYILHYFDIKGRAEHIRYLLHHKKVDFVDHRINKGPEWEAIKPRMPSGQVPVLEIDDGKMLSQSVAIMRYLGNEFGLRGSNAWENAKLDEAAHACDDTTKDISKYRLETNESTKEVLRKELVDDILPTKYNTLVRMMNISETHPYILGQKLSWADFFVAATVERADSLVLGNKLSGFNRTLADYVERIKSLDGVKEYVAQRKYTEA